MKVHLSCTTPGAKAPISHWIGDWKGLRAGLDIGKKRKISSHTRIWTPDHPIHSLVTIPCCTMLPWLLKWYMWKIKLNELVTKCNEWEWWSACTCQNIEKPEFISVIGCVYMWLMISGRLEYKHTWTISSWTECTERPDKKQNKQTKKKLHGAESFFLWQSRNLLYLWKPKVHYHVQNSPPFVHILSQLNPVHTVSNDLLHIKFNKNLCLGFPSGLFPLRFTHHNSVCASPLPQMCYISCPSHSYWYKKWNTLGLCYSLNVRDQVSQLHKKTGKL